MQHPSSYWPLKFADRFTPNHFFVKGETVWNVRKENNDIKDPSEVFKRDQAPTDPKEIFKWKGDGGNVEKATPLPTTKGKRQRKRKVN
jgi:hypothetical protein